MSLVECAERWRPGQNGAPSLRSSRHARSPIGAKSQVKLSSSRCSVAAHTACTCFSGVSVTVEEKEDCFSRKPTPMCVCSVSESSGPVFRLVTREETHQGKKSEYESTSATTL